MQKGNHLEFACLSCNKPIRFSILEKDRGTNIKCADCEREYLFDDATICRQLRKFEALCRQVLESEEILGNTSVGINVGEHHVKVPYKLLLTRLNACLDLSIGEKPLTITFRLEPKIDLYQK